MESERRRTVDWRMRYLGEVASIDVGGTPSTGVPSYWGGDVPWMTSGDVHLRRIYDVPGRITIEGLAGSNAKLVRPPAVAVALAGQGKTRGTVGVTECTLSSNQSVALIRGFTNALNTAYLFHELDRRYEELRARSSGGGRGGLSVSILSRLPMNLPPLSAQRRIADTLDTVDDAIRSTDLLTTKLEQVKQGLLEDLLTRGVDESGQLRDPHRHRFIQTPLGMLPESWHVEPIEALLADVSPAIRSGPFGSALLKSELVDEGIPMLGIDNVETEHFVRDYSRFVSYEKYQELARYTVRPRDVMVTIMGTVGRCCVVPDDIGRALSSKHVWTLTFDQNLYLPQLACLQINYSDWVLRHFARDIQGGIMSAIRSDTLRTTLLPVPPLAEQRRIEQILRTQQSRIEIVRQESAKLRRLKQGLMDDLLTGRVRVGAADGASV